ncbi:hypothetical protein P3T73_15880 [Kiritimatiellota bacterium B12222]|nr:hypothetical protein P3T73_15880 [Kiritimatiellota bacterium B12222]
MKYFLLSLFMFSALHAAPLPQDVDETLLKNTMIYLYRWVLDEEDVGRVFDQQDLSFWVKELSPELDEGDNSRMILIWFPQLELAVSMRKADYEIPELDIKVQNKTFEVSNILRGVPPENPEGFAVVDIPYEDLEAHAFETRADAKYPEGEFLQALRDASATHLQAHFEGRNQDFPEGEQVVYFSPLSDVSNDLWVFWETGGKLLQLSSDMDLEDSLLWTKKGIRLHVFDIKEQTVVHLNEVAGSNAYMTRDQVGRYLFNCLVLGKRVVFQHGVPQP